MLAARLGRGGCSAAIRAITPVTWPCGFDQFVAAAGEPAPELCLSVPVPPDPARLMQLAAIHGIQILPPPES